MSKQLRLGVQLLSLLLIALLVFADCSLWRERSASGGGTGC
jgi:hypothetical protein